MQLTSTRKKANAITSNILNRIAVRGQRKVADALGINESQISRWKDSFIPKMAMLLAVLEWGVEDEELAELAKKVAMVLTKKSLKTAATVLRPDVERLDQSTGVIMTKRRKKYQEKEEIRHPDSPEGLVVAAANNRAFAERLVGVYRLAKAGVKHGRR